MSDKGEENQGSESQQMKVSHRKGLKHKSKKLKPEKINGEEKEETEVQDISKGPLPETDEMESSRLNEEDPDMDRASKKKSRHKPDIKKAFRNIKSKLTPRKKNKNLVQEISIKPDDDLHECWLAEPAKKSSKKHIDHDSLASTSRSQSASSKNSKCDKMVDLEEEEDDGIPVIYDAAVHGGLEL